MPWAKIRGCCQVSGLKLFPNPQIEPKVDIAGPRLLLLFLLFLLKSFELQLLDSFPGLVLSHGPVTGCINIKLLYVQLSC